MTFFTACETSPSGSANQRQRRAGHQSVSQRGELLDFTDQNHYKSGMEQNQNPELHADKPVKRAEPEPPSDTSRTQVSAHDVMIKAPSEADRRHEGRAKMAA